MNKRLAAKIDERNAVRALERVRVAASSILLVKFIVDVQDIKRRAEKISSALCSLEMALSERAKI